MKTESTVGQATLRVLVVEDDPMDFRALERMLADCPTAGIELTWVRSTVDAVTAARERPFDVFLVDYRLGGNDGLELLKTLRLLKIPSPFILVTGLEDSSLDDAACRAGADDYLVKGRFDADELIRTLRYAVSRSESNRELRLLKTALDQSPDCEAILSAGLASDVPGIVYANPMFQRVTGYSLTELRARPISILFGPRTDTLMREGCAHYRGGDAFNGEGKLYRADGTTFLGTIRVTDIQDPLHGTRHQLVLLRDVTTERQRENQVRDQARMLDLAQEGIITQDLEGRIIYCNQGARQLFGVGDSALHQGFQAVLKLDAEQLNEARRVTFAEDRWAGELALVAEGVSARWFQSHWTLMRDETGRPHAILTVNTDVTEQRDLREQALRSQRMEAIGSLAAGVAHDLNNILSPIVMSASLLTLDPEDPEAITELREAISDNAERGAQLVRQLLTFTRGTRENDRLVQVRHLAREIVKLARETFPPAIKVHLHMPSELWSVRGNPTELHQVLLNLAVNARDAMPGGGVLRISGENRQLDESAAAAIHGASPGPYAFIIVEDDGEGIPEAVREHIFDLFFTTKPEGQGTGIGLATVRRIIENLGGFVELSTAPGRGARFTIGLPAEAGEEDEPAPEENGSERGHGETVLVVDDEDAVRYVLKRSLEDNGYRTVTARDGVEGLRAFRRSSTPIQLVLSDILMPEMDGPSMVARLREEEPDLKVLFCSGTATHANDERNAFWRRDFPGVDCLNKPFTVAKLLQQVRQTLAAPQAGEDLPDLGGTRQKALQVSPA